MKDEDLFCQTCGGPILDWAIHNLIWHDHNFPATARLEELEARVEHFRNELNKSDVPYMTMSMQARMATDFNIAIQGRNEYLNSVPALAEAASLIPSDFGWAPREKPVRT